MISIFQAAILGFLQGISELFPISSLGHSVIFPSIIGWHINQKESSFLVFLVATHFATALVLFFYFWKDWLRIFKGILNSLKTREITSPDAKLGWLLIIGTIPAGVLGALFETTFQQFFASPKDAAGFLFLNGIVLFLGEMLRRRKMQSVNNDSEKRISKISWWQGISIGTAQAIALFPGFSRTGSTLVGGLLVGLSHEDAVRYSFLLATPIIAAAAIAKLPDLVFEKTLLLPVIIGAVCAAIAAFFSVKFLTRYFKTRNLFPFAVYCFVVGGILFLTLR